MTPLGFVDAQSITPRDLAVCDLVYADRTGEIFQGVTTRSPVHYFRDDPRGGDPDQVLRFDEGWAVALLAALGVRRPTSPADARPRQSIEVRAFAFFD